jgi:UDP-N-acetylglucosamine enolpyruvyl transferase
MSDEHKRDVERRAQARTVHPGPYPVPPTDWAGVQALGAQAQGADPVVERLHLTELTPISEMFRGAGALLREVETHIPEGPVAARATELRALFDRWIPGWEDDLEAGTDQN